MNARQRLILIGAILAAGLMGWLVSTALAPSSPEGTGPPESSSDGLAARGLDLVEADDAELVPTTGFERWDGTTGLFIQYRERPLVVNFFASTCVPCLTEMPEIERVYQRMGNQVSFLGVNVQDDPDAAAAVVAQTGVTFDLARDPDGSMLVAFGGTALPVTAFVTPDGTIARTFIGVLDEDRLEQIITEELQP